MSAARTTVVQNTLTHPGTGEPVAGRPVSIRLNVPGFVNDGTSEKVRTRYATTDDTGLWSVELEVNADIDPAGTYYTVSEVPGVMWAFVVGYSATPVTLRSCLVDAPGNPSPLAAGVQSVTGQGVDNTDPLNPVITGGGGAGAVASVFGRTGTVNAQSGDYTAAQVGAATPAAVTAAQTAAATDATTKANTAQAFAVQRGNHTGTQTADTVTDGTTNKSYTAAEKTKLAGVSTAVVNPTGTASGATFLRGDGAWGTPAAPNYDKALQRYNFTAANTQTARAAESRALAGTGLCSVMGLGTSLTAGSGASQATAWPTQYRKQLAARGYPIAGTGWVLPGGNPADARIAFGGGAGTFTASFSALATNNGTANATMTFTTDLPGTVLEVVYLDSPGAFTYKVDAASAVTVTPGSSSALTKLTVTGLANTTHTIVFTWTTSNYGFIAAVNCRQTTGLQVSNFGYAGFLTPDPTALQPYSLFNVAKFVAADLTYVEYGTNDASSNQTNLTAVVNTLRTAGSGVILLTEPPRATTGSLGSDQNPNIYAVADTLNVPLIDWGDRFGVPDRTVLGPTAQAAAYNALPSVWLPGDATHFTAEGYMDVATMIRTVRGF